MRPGLFDERTRLLAITQVSNVLGTENPLAALMAWPISMARKCWWMARRR
jgi:cysteine desulfurase/selenocysteine lyase